MNNGKVKGKIISSLGTKASLIMRCCIRYMLVRPSNKQSLFSMAFGAPAPKVVISVASHWGLSHKGKLI